MLLVFLSLLCILQCYCTHFISLIFLGRVMESLGFSCHEIMSWTDKYNFRWFFCIYVHSPSFFIFKNSWNNVKFFSNMILHAFDKISFSFDLLICLIIYCSVKSTSYHTFKPIGSWRMILLYIFDYSLLVFSSITFTYAHQDSGIYLYFTFSPLLSPPFLCNLLPLFFILNLSLSLSPTIFLPPILFPPSSLCT